MQPMETRKDKTRHEWVGKGIRWELCNWWNFERTTTWDMHKPEPVLVNETNKIHQDFEVQKITEFGLEDKTLA